MSSFMGVEVPEPIICAAARELDFANETGYAGTTRFMKQTAGLWMLEECRRAWIGTERDLDASVMMHLAAQSPPFESLINPMDLRFMTPGDMPLKVKEFCKETGQAVPRKPGAIIRCVLESTALYYRKTLREIEDITKQRIEQLYLLGGGSNPLFNSFITNALQVPVVVVPEEVTVIGNMLVQGIGLKHIESLEQARQIVRDSFTFEMLYPHAEVWNSAFQRLEEFTGTF
jgi:sugar (pentulose or hexulose) kinase